MFWGAFAFSYILRDFPFVFREIGNIDSAELNREKSAKNYQSFLERLALLRPNAILPYIGYIVNYLEEEVILLK